VKGDLRVGGGGGWGDVVEVGGGGGEAGDGRLRGLWCRGRGIVR